MPGRRFVYGVSSGQMSCSLVVEWHIYYITDSIEKNHKIYLL